MKATIYLFSGRAGSMLQEVRYSTQGGWGIWVDRIFSDEFGITVTRHHGDRIAYPWTSIQCVEYVQSRDESS